MSTAVAVQPKPEMPPEPIWRISVDQYHEMVKHGIIDEDDNVELLDGWLVPKMTKNPQHVFANGMLRELLPKILPSGWFVETQDPITVGNSEPEPDIAIVRGTHRDYVQRHPTAQDVALIAEIADSSLYRDKGLKKRVYAAGGVVCYWIVNLNESRIEVYTEPSGPLTEPDYRQRQDFGIDETVPILIDGSEVGRVAVRELLP